MNIAVILAGGVGARLGADCPKQFVKVLGKPVIVYTIEKFESHPEIDAIEIVCVESYIGYLKELVSQYGFQKVRIIVRGGSVFQESVINGLNGLNGFASEEDILLIHWAASPFISHEEISDGIRVCKSKGNCIAAYPAYLLYGRKSQSGDSSTEGIDRDTFMIMNAPQCFKYGYVRQMYDEAAERGILDRIDPHTTSLMYEMGREIFFSKGSQNSIKITTKEDLEMFLGYVLAQKYNKNQLNDKVDCE